MSSSAAPLYEEDFVRSTEEQARALRKASQSRVNLALDWQNLAEEIDDLGRSVRRELRRRLTVIVEHLMKLEHSQAIDPRGGWMDTINRERLSIEDLLEDSPSLRRELPSMIERLKPRVARLATSSLFGYGETVKSLPVPAYTEDQVLAGWFPGDSSLPANGEQEESG